MEENCIAVGGGGEMGKAAEGESRHIVSSWTEGEMIYVLSSPSVSGISVSIKFVSIKITLHLRTSHITAFHYCLSYKLLSVKMH